MSAKPSTNSTDIGLFGKSPYREMLIGGLLKQGVYPCYPY